MTQAVEWLAQEWKNLSAFVVVFGGFIAAGYFIFMRNRRNSKR